MPVTQETREAARARKLAYVEEQKQRHDCPLVIRMARPGELPPATKVARPSKAEVVRWAREARPLAGGTMPGS